MAMDIDRRLDGVDLCTVAVYGLAANFVAGSIGVSVRIGLSCEAHRSCATSSAKMST